MKVTYILGAGASYNTLPIVDQIPDEFMEVASNILKLQKDDGIKLGMRHIEDFYKQTEYIINRSRQFKSIDTYAQYLYESDNFDNGITVNTIKQLISYFFFLIQAYKPTHDRLFYFFTKLKKNIHLNHDNLESNIDILTWNYDFQVELVLNELFLNKNNIEDLMKSLKVFPNKENEYFGHEYFNVLHLNGIAGIFDAKAHGRDIIGTLFFRSFKNSFNEAFWNTLNVYEHISKNTLSIDRLFTFLWEQNKYRDKLINHAYDIIELSDIIIIIGYSFPHDNRAFDKNWLDLLIHKDKLLIIQDPKPNLEWVNEIKSKGVKVKLVSTTDHYFIPDELLI